MANTVDITAELDHAERLIPRPEIIPAVPDFAEMTLGINPNTLHRYAQPAPHEQAQEPARQSTVTVEEVIDEPQKPTTAVNVESVVVMVSNESNTTTAVDTTAVDTPAATPTAAPAPVTAPVKPVDDVAEDNIVHKPFSVDDLAEMKKEFARIAEENRVNAEREKKEAEDRRVALAKAAEERRAKWAKDEPALARSGATGNLDRYFISEDEFYNDDDYTDMVMSAKAGTGKRNVVSWDEDKLDDIQSKVENVEDLTTAIANEVESISERLGDTRRRQKDMNDAFRQLDTYIRSDTFVDKIVDRLVQKLCGAQASAKTTTETTTAQAAAQAAAPATTQ